VKKLLGFLRLMRPANIVTAVADILAGISIAGFFHHFPEDLSPIVWLVLATAGLYGGGVVMNDVFDAQLDSVERPERPIPSGLISRSAATVQGLLLLAAGVFFAFFVSVFSGVLALTIAVAAVAYDKWTKHHSFFGPLNMGICRGLNLLLGLSIIPGQARDLWYLAIVPVVYIAAITMISQGEVYGGKKQTMIGAVFLYVLAMGAILYVAFHYDRGLIAFVFVALWAFMVFWPLQKAVRRPEGKFIGKAVKAGVLGLILMNAAWASAFGAIGMALIILLLLPLSLLLAKIFAVT
jgi:4-hydroxybenzoate polyprenyltransferase